MERGLPTLEIELEINNDDTVFLHIEGGGTAVINEITRNTVVITGDNPMPSAVEQWEIACPEPHSWRIEVPLDEIDVLIPFITSIQKFNR